MTHNRHLQKISSNATFAPEGAADGLWRPCAAAQQLSGSAIREILKVTEQADMLSFAGGLPNPAAFPVEAIRAATALVLADDAIGALQYGPTEGYGELRAQIAARLTASGQATAQDEVLITTGSQQALDLIGKAFLSPGSTLLAANPSYLGALQAFALYQAQVVDLETAWEGLPTRPAFCYLTPTFANPDGATMSSAARQALVARLQNASVPLIEDDPYGELWCDAPPPRACRTLAPECTLYLGSFSKVLAPGLRVGYIAGPRDTIALLSRLKQAADLHTPSLNQRIVSTLIADGTLDRHLPTVRALYQQQRDALMAALDRHLRPYADWSVPAGGMFAWLRLKDGRDAAILFQAALDRRVAFVPGAPFYFGVPDGSTLRLAYSTVPAALMDEGMARLANAANEVFAVA